MTAAAQRIASKRIASTRLADLRAELARRDLDGLLVPRADAFLGEYVPPSAERLAWLSGFTGSAGLALVLRDRAILFVDGRYTTQAAAEVAPGLWELRHLLEQPPAEFLRTDCAGARIGYDPWLHPAAAVERLEASGARLVPQPSNPVDAVWTDRPAPPSAPAQPHPIDFAGVEGAAKREEAAARLRADGAQAAVLADPHSVAWLLNIRGQDLGHTPLVLAMALLRADARLDLFLDPARADAALRAHLGNAVALHPPEALPAVLEGLAGQRVRLDPDVTPAWFGQHLRAAGAEVVAGEDPCRLPRACKNPVEQEGARAAHLRDAVALCRFLAWFAEAAPAGAETELSAAAKLLALRAEGAHFVAESFPAISGAGEHGAIIHYRATPSSDRPIRPGECYLIDSGAQYRDGTTDVTRTLWTGPGDPPAELAERYTMVLQGHLALSALRFPEGVAGPHLDSLARRSLWAAGLDYDHGTGHGVGSFLSVHEGPAGISRSAKPVPLRPGMILSNEPGFYLPGAYGIRIENLLLVRQAAGLPGQSKPFLDFETLTWAPYERRLIALPLLAPAERAQIDAYHAACLARIGPLLPKAAESWLRAACAPL
ncbi:aminopeptidase P family protein [Falsiroseomonas tokyonensis]|uniref:Aminopeptidase P family protein n=1 Tax=Falsiroseomonas tokyonensis TaxID=430521 RepID=A0ABV7BLK1_9PROT|nr:aminopeptidase P family protein [Falsiroseomonas tokyonensis]MBU8536442.1 aminopeptidase P family protein [Falsiroseomonas tokyonensis]